MGTKVAVRGLLLLCTIFALLWGTRQSAPTVAASDEGTTVKASPAEGYTVHVLARIWWRANKWGRFTIIVRCWHPTQ